LSIAFDNTERLSIIFSQPPTPKGVGLLNQRDWEHQGWLAKQEGRRAIHPTAGSRGFPCSHVFMKSIQVTYDEILKHILIFAKKEEKDGIITIYRPDFSARNSIPGIKPNWSPDKVEFNKKENVMKVWRIRDKERPSVIARNIFPDEQGFSDVEGLSGDEIPAPLGGKKTIVSKKRKDEKVEEPKGKSLIPPKTFD